MEEWNRTCGYVKEIGKRLTGSDKIRPSWVPMGRLTSASVNGQTTQYLYQNNSTLNTKITPSGPVNIAFNDQDQVTNYGNNNYGYSANGERNVKMNSSSTTQYLYDFFGNLRGVDNFDPTQPNTPSDIWSIYSLDALGRSRIGKAVLVNPELPIQVQPLQNLGCCC